MTEAIATDMLRSYIDRILRLKAEQDDLGADIREIYAEAKSNGFDKTRLGEVVSYIRKRDKKGAAEIIENESIFDLYLSVYDGTASRARAREESLDDSADGFGDAVGCTPKPASGAKEVPAPRPIAASEPDTRDAATPRAGQSREQSPARGDIDIGLPSFLDRKSPDCIANRAQGRG